MFCHQFWHDNNTVHTVLFLFILKVLNWCSYSKHDIFLEEIILALVMEEYIMSTKNQADRSHSPKLIFT